VQGKLKERFICKVHQHCRNKICFFIICLIIESICTLSENPLKDSKSHTLTGYIWPMLIACLSLIVLLILSNCLHFEHHLSHHACIPQNLQHLIAPSGLNISISFYHECLHSIAFNHARILSIPHDKFIDPDSSANNNGTTTIILSHIGVVNFSSCSSLVSCIYTSNLNYDLLMMTSKVSSLCSMNSQPLI